MKNTQRRLLNLLLNLDKVCRSRGTDCQARSHRCGLPFGTRGRGNLAELLHSQAGNLFYYHTLQTNQTILRSEKSILPLFRKHKCLSLNLFIGVTSRLTLTMQ